MKIALLGYGKMGKTIENIAQERGHEIVFRINKNIENYHLEEADVAIDFSIPDAAFKNISFSLNKKVPVISGTTGWLDKYENAKVICQENDTAFLYASNFSVGVNLFFQLNEKLAELMSPFHDYKVSIEEIHHTQKLDAPSGTAISLAQQIIKNTNKTGWKLEHAEEKEIPITVKREDSVPGTHTITYASKIDDLEIKHTAHSRMGFALGAVMAAEFLVNKKGIFSMKDVLAELK